MSETRAEEIELWRCTDPDCRMIDTFPFRCHGDTEKLTATIPPPGSVCVVLSEEDIATASMVAEFFVSGTGTGAGEWIAKVLAASESHPKAESARTALSKEEETPDA